MLLKATLTVPPDNPHTLIFEPIDPTVRTIEDFVFDISATDKRFVMVTEIFVYLKTPDPYFQRAGPVGLNVNTIAKIRDLSDKERSYPIIP